MNRKHVEEIGKKSKAERWPFPKTFEELKAAGVASYKFDVATAETTFTGDDGAYFSEVLDAAGAVSIAPALDASAVLAAIKRHMMDKTPFLDFRADAARAGVQYWEVDMNARTCAYFGKDGGRHIEQVPQRS